MRYYFFNKIWKGTFTRGGALWGIICIAVVPPVLVRQVSHSMIEGISSRIIETDSYHMSMLFDSYAQKDDTKQKKLIQTLSTLPSVIGVYEEVRGIGIVRNKTHKAAIQLRGIESALLQDKGMLQYLQLIDGSMTFKNNKSMILGNVIAKKLQVGVGDTVLLLTTQSNNVNALPKITRGVVTGIVSTGYEELDRSWVFMKKEAVSKLLMPQDQNWRIGIKIKDPFILPNIMVQRSQAATQRGKALQATVRRLLYFPGSVYSWYELYKNRYILFIDTKSLLGLVMMIAVVLATITLSSSMGMRVVDLETDIAMLKAIGASPRQLEFQVFLQGLRYGILGSFIGCIIGILLAFQINTIISLVDSILNGARMLFGQEGAISILNPQYYLKKISFRIYPLELLAIIGYTVGLSVLSAWIPSRKIRNIPALKIIQRH